MSQHYDFNGGGTSQATDGGYGDYPVFHDAYSQSQQNSQRDHNNGGGGRGLPSSTSQLNLSRFCLKKTLYTP